MMASNRRSAIGGRWSGVGNRQAAGREQLSEDLRQPIALCRLPPSPHEERKDALVSYSARIASNGSTLAARRPGITDASRATTPNTAITVR
jgi:hypothetical protein